jgi:hypothetical protein
MQLYSDAGIDMGYKMPTYRIGDAWVALANQKQYISLYSCALLAWNHTNRNILSK